MGNPKVERIDSDGDPELRKQMYARNLQNVIRHIKDQASSGLSLQQAFERWKAHSGMGPATIDKVSAELGLSGGIADSRTRDLEEFPSQQQQLTKEDFSVAGGPKSNPDKAIGWINRKSGYDKLKAADAYQAWIAQYEPDDQTKKKVQRIILGEMSGNHVVLLATTIVEDEDQGPPASDDDFIEQLKTVTKSWEDDYFAARDQLIMQTVQLLNNRAQAFGKDKVFKDWQSVTMMDPVDQEEVGRQLGIGLRENDLESEVNQDIATAMCPGMLNNASMP